ncbi:MAG: MBOAT family protein [Gemmataceae bacterium]
MSDWPRWGVMWLIAFGLFASLKLLTILPILKSSKPVAIWKYGAYLLAWPGMDAEAFLFRSGAVVRWWEWPFAIGKTVLGLGLTGFGIHHSSDWPPFTVGLVGMIGIPFVLHFGLFHILSCVWRTAGCDARPIMNWPILSTSLTDFWGKRWNLAFRDLTYRYLFHPCVKWFGAVGRMSFGFFASGLIHELVITIPAGGCYGLPTLYFLIQLFGVFLERSTWAQPVRGRVFTALFLIVPAICLFPPLFVEGVMQPFMQFLGGAW